MSEIKEVISLLSSAEERKFIAHLGARNKRHDTRNVDLFKALIQNNEDRIKKKIGDNAFNVLKKRLFDRLLDFMATATLESEASAEGSIIKQILIARKLFSFEKFKVAFRILYKAEKEALKMDHFALLSEIYHTLTEHSHQDMSINHEALFRKVESNNQSFIGQERLNMVYAVVRRAFLENEQDSKSIDLKEILDSNYSKYGISPEQGYSFKSLYQIAMMADIAGAHAKDYYSVDLFFVDKIKEMQGGEGDTEKMLIYHIDLLYSVANIYLRKKKFETSLNYLELMHSEMQRFNQKFHQKRMVKYTTLVALNLNFTGEHKQASILLEEMFELKGLHEDELLSAKLARAMIHFQQGELEHVSKILSKFQSTDKWYERHIGNEWVLNKRFIEILLYIELGDVDYVDSRVTSLTRKYGEMFKSNENDPVLPFLKLVRMYFNQPDIVQTEVFKKQIEATIPWKSVEQEDIFFMCFYAWMKAKTIDRTVYDVTLEMVGLEVRS
jgi:hypothetical protein